MSALVREGADRLPLGHVLARARAGRQWDRPTVQCDLCAGTGWADGERRPTGRVRPDGHVVTTSTCVPCRCTAGKAAYMLADKIIEGNAR